MKILLVQPPHPSVGESRHAVGQGHITMTEPLALEYVGAGVRDFCDVRLIDMRLENEFEGLQGTLEKYEPDVVASTGFTANVNDCKRITRKAKAFNKNILTVVGGHHATVAPEDFIDESIDVVAIGWEGVFTFRDIVQTFQRGGDLRTVQGIGVYKEGKLCRTPPRSGISLNDLPLPDRSLTKHLHHSYRHLSPLSPSSIPPVALIRSMEGCSHKCDFCAGWVAAEGKLHTSDPELVIKDLSSISVEFVQWVDASAFADRDKALQLATLIKESGIKKMHFITTRTDEIVRNPGLVEKWREIGLFQVLLGLEACHDEDLDKMNKHTSVQQNREAIRIIHENGARITGSFLIDPSFDKSDFERLAEHIDSLNVDYPFCFILTPLPGTMAFEAAKDRLTLHNWAFWDLFHAVVPTKLELEEFYNEFVNLLARTVGEKFLAWAGTFKEETGQDLAEDLLLGELSLARELPGHHALDEPNL